MADTTVHSLAKQVLKAMTLPQLEQSKMIEAANKEGRLLNISPNQIGAYVMQNQEKLQAEIDKEKGGGNV